MNEVTWNKLGYLEIQYSLRKNYENINGLKQQVQLLNNQLIIETLGQ